jgi:type III secretory pathway component EscS
LGIALVPAAYLHFTRMVLLATWLQPESRLWTWLVRAAFFLSALFAVLAVATDVLVRPATGAIPVTHLQPGPLFPLFTLYFIVASLWGGFNLLQARSHARTLASKRRLNYLLWSFAAPGLGVFPYLILVSRAGASSPSTVLILSSIANIAVGIMLVVMAYSVAYYGVLSPDRVVKRQLVLFLLQGPVVAAIVVGLILGTPRVEAILGLPPDTALTLFVVITIVLAPLVLHIIQPWIDLALYRNDSEEVQHLRTLETRLMTSSDLSQFLENVLVSICDAFGVGEGFVAVPGETDVRLEAVMGDAEAARNALSLPAIQTLLTTEQTDNDWHEINGYSVRSLINRHNDQPLGIIALHHPSFRQDDLPPETAAVIQHLLRRAEIAVEDRRLQLDVFAALQPILPDIEVMQALQGAVPYVIAAPDAQIDDLTQRPEFNEWVRDALSHFWGGPKLSDSPLLDLNVVRERQAEFDGVPTRTLRAVLQSAIERQRPPGERQMTTSQWLLYNILDLKYIQGKRVREVANRLAMSESDLYRKQRTAISEVARAIADMEANADTQDST